MIGRRRSAPVKVAKSRSGTVVRTAPLPGARRGVKLSPARPGSRLPAPRRAGARVRREIARVALRSERPRGRWGPEEKRTLALGVLAAATFAAVVGAGAGRVWKRGP